MPDLEAVEKERMKIREGLRIWHLFIPFSGDDVRSYRSLLRYVKPHAMKMVASTGLAAVASVFLVTQVWLLEQGLTDLLDQTNSEQHSCPECETVLDVVDHSSRSPGLIGRLQSAGLGEEGEGTEAEAAGETAAPDDSEGEEESESQFALRVHDHNSAQLDQLAEDEKDRRKDSLWYISGLLILAVLFEGSFKFCQAVLMARASRMVVLDLRKDVFRHVVHMPLRFHQKNHSAKLMSRITHDMEIFGRFLTEALVRAVRELFTFGGLIGYVIYQNGAFIMVIGAMIALAMIPVKQIGRRLRRSNQKMQSGMADVYKQLAEAFRGQRVVKAFGAEEREAERFDEVALKFTKRMMRMRTLRALTEPLVALTGSFGIAGVIIVGGSLAIDNPSFTAATFFSMILALGRAMTSLRTTSKQFNEFQIGLAAADRVGTLLAAPREQIDAPGKKKLTGFEDRIAYQNVTFHHRPDEPALHDVSFTIHKGETVALVGPSGSGKSTIADLLPRFYDVGRGAIKIDGVKVDEVTLESLRDLIGIVSQETILFDGSIRDNIAYGRPDASDEEVIAAAKAANAHEFIVSRKRGYDTPMHEGGHVVSGGERQRLSIARALLKDPPILVLDEATSALDSESEAVVQAALHELMKNRTVLVVAHRLSTIQRADKIIALDKGRIVETGKHDELIQRGGAYKRLYELQRGPVQEPQAPTGTA